MFSNSEKVPVNMSKDRTSPLQSDEEENLDYMCIPGLGQAANQPKPRVLGTSFFGYVPDAFSEKTPSLPSERTGGNPQSLKQEKVNNQVSQR